LQRYPFTAQRSEVVKDKAESPAQGHAAQRPKDNHTKKYRQNPPNPKIPIFTKNPYYGSVCHHRRNRPFLRYPQKH
jgi:hypothetical protein